MGYSLYQDPMQSQPIEVLYTGIGYRWAPDSFSLSDPVFLRHILVMMCVVRNMFHVYLCWRQLRLCQWVKELPSEMQSAMSKEDFQLAKVDEGHAVEQKLLSYIFDAIFSCFELYLGVLPALWRVIIRFYSIVDDLIWQSIAFVWLFTSYMVLRGLPLVFYTKLVLEPFYDVSPDKSIPLVGLLCSFALLIVLLQVALIPLTTIFLFIESHGGSYFVLWIWGFLFVTSLLLYVLINLYGISFFGQQSKLPEGALSNALKDLLPKFEFPTDCVYVIRTFSSNNATAYAFGCFCRRQVVILENLFWNHGRPESELRPEEIGKGLTDDQLIAYIAHELSHWYFQHSRKVFCMAHATLLMYLIIFGTCYRQSVLYEAAGFPKTFYPPIVGYWLVYKYVMPLYVTITNWIVYYFMRRFEFAADKYTCKLGFSSELISALLKLFSDYRMFPYVDPWFLMWHRIKPSYLHRVKKLIRMQTTFVPVENV
ncbi:CAAX prenyl protease 1 homolog [Drosophila innubila]|uniref:CAAX prenyl protease 1 homolog n=1 Tax=Drosophila innubila TaxID=198719 RepID=UPI00148B514D|nr:CAAX prenyl protease 1 homolog [Drosophila innubila]